MYSKFQKLLCASILLALTVAFFAGTQIASAATLADGTYTIDYVIKKPEDESVSMANDYWEKPATVIASGGTLTVQMTINHSEWVTQFKVPSGSSYTDAKVISQDSAKNTRLVQFSLASLDKPMLSQIHVTVPEIDYDHDYTIRFVYNTDTLKLISEPKSNSATEPTATPEPTPQPKASTTPNPKDTSSVKPDGGKENVQPTASSAPQATASSPALTEASKTPKPTTPQPSTEPVKSASEHNEKAAEIGSSVDGAAAEAGGTEQQAEEQVGEQADDQAEPQAQSEQDGSGINPNDTAEGNEGASDQATVELSSALDGAAIDDSATTIAASVSEQSDKKSGVIIIAFLSILLVACVVLVVVYRRRKGKKI